MMAFRDPRRRDVTAALMGDPRPERQAVSEALRLRALEASHSDPPVPVDILAVIEALSDGPMPLENLADEIGLSLSEVHRRIQGALLLGLVERLGRSPRYRFSLTDAGRDSLGAAS